MKRLIIVTNKNDLFIDILSNYKLNYKIFNDEQDFKSFTLELDKDDVLISYSHSIIFSQEVIEKIMIGYNIHAGSPDFPGRDPHHWAVYTEAKKFGVVVHHIDKLVDSGSIVDIELFNIKEKTSPKDLLFKADIIAEKLIVKLIHNLSLGVYPKQLKEVKWSRIKKSRKDFLDKCFINHNMQLEELDRRIKAFHVEGKSNLYTQIGKERFYFKKTNQTNKITKNNNE